MRNFFFSICGDIRRYAPKGRLVDFVKVVFFNHAFHLVFFVRVGQACRKVPIFGSVLGIFVEYFIRIFFSSDISCKAKIGPGLIIVHGHDIVIGSGVCIGKNCKIFNGVTLGNKDTEGAENAQPTIGDGVVLGTGSKLLGGIFVGDEARTGANSVVISNVPSCTLAVGVPAKIKKRAR